MLIFWRIRYLDTRDKEFKDRDLWLLTDELDAITKAAVETCRELSKSGGDREMLKYRKLFKEVHKSPEEIEEMLRQGHK
ncbi:MAG: hypothetical protein K8S99_02470 [Planctomycetes bacterium]|nr:hypothetical protein [Planctomycetota bacterium]